MVRLKPGASRIAAAFLFCLAFLPAACAPPFPKDMQEKVNKNIAFGELKKAPDKYQGAWVMLGGMIVGAKNGTLIEVLQKPLEADGRPARTDASDGRFLVQSGTFLDTAIYHPGRELTVIAVVLGGKEQPIDETTYQYPLCDAKSLHLWSLDSGGPRFFFGLGVSQRL